MRHNAQQKSRNNMNKIPTTSLALICAISIAPLVYGNTETPIPHGTIAKASGKGIVKAWYSCPTERYRHAVLGDAIEGGCLVVIDDAGKQHSVALPESQVFEDNTPRIADIDGDGLNDVVTIRSELDAGAAIAVYGITDDSDQLTELAATPPIGLSNRWLAPAGIADFNGDGALDIAYVQTPHIGGTLRIWSIVDGVFTELDRLGGFSNHSIGATRVSISRVLDDNDDGLADLALPDQSGSLTVIVTMKPDLQILRQLPFDSAFY